MKNNVAKEISSQKIKIDDYRVVWPFYYQLTGKKVPGNWLCCRKEFTKAAEKYWDAVFLKKEDLQESVNDIIKEREKWGKVVGKIEFESNPYHVSKYDSLAVIVPGMEKSFVKICNELVSLVKKRWKKPAPEYDEKDVLLRVADSDKSLTFFSYCMDGWGLPILDETLYSKLKKEEKSENTKTENLMWACRSMLRHFKTERLLRYLNGENVKIDPIVINVLISIGAFKEEDIKTQNLE